MRDERSVNWHQEGGFYGSDYLPIGRFETDAHWDLHQVRAPNGRREAQVSGSLDILNLFELLQLLVPDGDD